MKRTLRVGTTHRAIGLAITASFLVGGWLATAVGAADMPGAGRTVTPCYDGTDEALFQTEVVAMGLAKLGYDVKPSIPLNVTSMYLGVAGGDATFTASAWDPLQNAFFDKAGGEAKLQHVGTLIAGATQGYFIDK